MSLIAALVRVVMPKEKRIALGKRERERELCRQGYSRSEARKIIAEQFQTKHRGR